MLGILFKLILFLATLIWLASRLFSKQQKRAIHETASITAIAFMILAILMLIWTIWLKPN